MAEEKRQRVRYKEPFWRAHHDGWKRSDLNQREYCALHGLPLKAFGNWRATFKAEPKTPEPRLLYRRSSLSHSLSHPLSHSLSHMTDDALSRLIVPPGRTGRRRVFSEEDKRRIVAETSQPGMTLSGVARHYGIAARVLFRWKQELAVIPPVFAAVQIVDDPAREGPVS